MTKSYLCCFYETSSQVNYQVSLVLKNRNRSTEVNLTQSEEEARKLFE